MENIDWVAVLIDLILTIFGYLLVPTIIRITTGELEKNKAKKIAIINAIVVDLIFFIIALAVSEETPKINFIPAIFWGTVGYNLMKKDENEDNDDFSENENQENSNNITSETNNQEEIKSNIEKDTVQTNTNEVKEIKEDAIVNNENKEQNTKSRSSIIWIFILVCSILLLLYQSSEINELKETIASKNATISSLNQQVSELNETVSTQQTTIDDLNTKLEQAVTILNLINNARK